MDSTYDTLMRVVSASTPREQRLVAIRNLAIDLNWTPSYEFHGPFGADVAEDHLVVEHGLENSAIISFLKAPMRIGDLDSNTLRSLLTISYNNLIDWHIFVSEAEVSYVYNLTPTSFGNVQSISRSNFFEHLSADRFDEIVNSKTVRRSAPPCDDAFINIISRWKRLIKADYPDADNRHISALFNTLILIRGCEDHKISDTGKSGRVLLEALQANEAPECDLIDIAKTALHSTGIEDDLHSFIEVQRLEPFRHFDRTTATDLLRDFYRPSGALYEFNFALMSKHALSRIYERYVSLLEFDEENDAQLSFLAATPSEKAPTKSGAVYTPQYVAGFFSRYLQDNLTPRAFRNLRIVDPACGSGIFLRTLLEVQCNPLVPGTTLQTIRDAFNAVTAIDRDANACEATFLSLALLYLVATGTLPRKLDIRNTDAIALALNGEIEPESYGAVIANPPYIKRDFLTSDELDVMSRYLGESGGRVDTYLAFVKLCLSTVTSGGFVCLVLPQAFLLAKNASALRKAVSDGFYVRCLVDLSAVRVFEGVGTYNILLILQKKSDAAHEMPIAQIAKVQEFVGPALQACLDHKVVDTPYYRVFEVGQGYFDRDEWVLLSPADIALQQKVSSLKPISYYLDVMQGFVSGADSVFIVPKKAIPDGESAVYVDFLPDRLIYRYSLPQRATEAVFYPYEDGRPLTEAELKRHYPKTWRYLSSHKRDLSKRRAVTSGDSPWWRPVRSRDPKNILRPKLVCPHLMLTPRFGVDTKGRFAVSHTPFLIAKDRVEEANVLKFFCAVLNSSISHWYLSTYLPKYGRGYYRVEVTSLKAMPVPDPADVPPATMREILELVTKAIKDGSNAEIETKLDQIVAGLYGLTSTERETYLS